MKETVKEYGKYRLEHDFKKLLCLCADDIVIESERDGRFEGKDQMLKYLKSTKPQGTWQEPVNITPTRVGVEGVVYLFFMPIQVVAFYDFDEKSEKIQKIVVKRGSL